MKIPECVGLGENRRVAISVGGSCLFEGKNFRTVTRDLFSLLMHKETLNTLWFNEELVGGLIELTRQLSEEQFVVGIVVGGGHVARSRIVAAKHFGPHDATEQEDKTGIYTTQANASQLLTAFKHAGVDRVDYYRRTPQLNKPVRWEHEQPGDILIRGGTTEGQSSDMATYEAYKAMRGSLIINITQTGGIHPKDNSFPQGYNPRKIVERMTCSEYLAMSPLGHYPGKSAPLQPELAVAMNDYGFATAIVSDDMKNLNRLLHGQEAKGTLMIPDNWAV